MSNSYLLTKMHLRLEFDSGVDPTCIFYFPDKIESVVRCGLSCPSCHITFSLITPLVTPLILSCLHTVCRACVEYKCLPTCPPVNYRIRGKAAEDRNEDEVQEYSDEAEKINRAQDSMSNFVFGTKAEEALVKLTKGKDNSESMMRKNKLMKQLK